MKRSTRIAAPVIAIGMAILLTGCPGDSSTQNDQNSTDALLKRLQKNQPIPDPDYSQFRQTAIDVENAQIHGVATTTFFFTHGGTKPYKVCPSIGFPVASTAQLTNPLQSVGNGAVIGQMEPNGVYTGISTGTHVTCVAPDGARYYVYAEPDTHAEGGAAHWDEKTQMIVLDGHPSALVNKIPGGK